MATTIKLSEKKQPLKTLKEGIRPCLHGVGDPGLVGYVSFVCVPQSVKIKETKPTRPGSPTPCKQALNDSKNKRRHDNGKIRVEVISVMP